MLHKKRETPEMAKVINTYTTATQNLVNAATDNPATVTSTGTIIVNSATAFADGLFGNNTFAWTVSNLGTVESIGSQGLGIILQAGGSVTNAASALIAGSQSGVTINGAAGTVVNNGTISETGVGGT